MIKGVYLDATMGISGDMLLAALSEWVQWDDVVTQLKLLPLEGWEAKRHNTRRCGIAAVKIDFHLESAKSHRHLGDILQMIGGAGWPELVVSTASAVFQALAEAEGEVHGVPVESVHFHEVGAIDSILDICGFAWVYFLLGQPRLFVSKLPLTQGIVRTEHGQMPVPAPATLKLLQGFQVFSPDNIPRGEAITPTAAAILQATKVKQSFPELPIKSVAHGAGNRDPAEYPNILRAIAFSEPVEDGSSVAVIEASIDDLDTRIYPEVIEGLMKEGALDAAVIPIIMKKGRPGFLLRVMCRPQDITTLSSLIFQETTTLGVSVSTRERLTLDRKLIEVWLEGVPVGVKVGYSPEGKVVNITPEFADCQAASLELGWGIKNVMARAGAKAQIQLGLID